MTPDRLPVRLLRRGAVPAALGAVFFEAFLNPSKIDAQAGVTASPSPSRTATATSTFTPSPTHTPDRTPSPANTATRPASPVSSVAAVSTTARVPTGATAIRTEIRPSVSGPTRSAEATATLTPTPKPGGTVTENRNSDFKPLLIAATGGGFLGATLGGTLVAAFLLRSGRMSASSRIAIASEVTRQLSLRQTGLQAETDQAVQIIQERAETATRPIEDATQKAEQVSTKLAAVIARGNTQTAHLLGLIKETRRLLERIQRKEFRTRLHQIGEELTVQKAELGFTQNPHDLTGPQTRLGKSFVRAVQRVIRTIVPNQS